VTVGEVLRSRVLTIRILQANDASRLICFRAIVERGIVSPMSYHTRADGRQSASDGSVLMNWPVVMHSDAAAAAAASTYIVSEV